MYCEGINRLVTDGFITCFLEYTYVPCMCIGIRAAIYALVESIVVLVVAYLYELGSSMFSTRSSKILVSLD